MSSFYGSSCHTHQSCISPALLSFLIHLQPFEIDFLVAQICSFFIYFYFFISLHQLHLKHFWSQQQQQPLCRCGVKIFSRALVFREPRAPAASVFRHMLLRTDVGQLGWMEREKGRLDGDFTDTNNFLMQRYCNTAARKQAAHLFIR